MTKNEQTIAGRLQKVGFMCEVHADADRPDHFRLSFDGRAPNPSRMAHVSLGIVDANRDHFIVRDLLLQPAAAPTPADEGSASPPADYKAARGALNWSEGDEPAEDTIRRIRDEEKLPSSQEGVDLGYFPSLDDAADFTPRGPQPPIPPTDTFAEFVDAVGAQAAADAPGDTPPAPTYEQLAARNADLLTCVRLYEGMLKEVSHDLDSLKAINTLQSDMLREALVLAGQPKRIEVCTLYQRLSNDFLIETGDEALADKLNAGWGIADISVVLGDITARVVTLTREVPADPAPQPEQHAHVATSAEVDRMTVEEIVNAPRVPQRERMITHVQPVFARLPTAQAIHRDGLQTILDSMNADVIGAVSDAYTSFAPVHADVPLLGVNHAR